jgi:uncharacterized membrane protein YkvA (DUF1232 family)
MAVRVKSWLSRPAVLRTLFSHVRLAVRLIREPGVPLVAKALPLLTAFYVISPLDLVPDFVPVLGQLDDLGIILIGLEAFLRVCPPAAVAFHRGEIVQSRHYSPMSPTGDVIDTEWRREE